VIPFYRARGYRSLVRILFTVYGSRPHIYPLVPLAWALRSVGHEVRLASTPSWADDLTHTGLPAVTVGGSPQVSRAERDALAGTIYYQPKPWRVDWATHIDRLDREQWDYLEAAGRYLSAAADAMTDDLIGFARDWGPDAVVYDTHSYAGAVAAAAVGVPGVSHRNGPDAGLRFEVIQPGLEPLPEYAALFERHGLAVPADPPATVDPTPPSMRVVSPPGMLGMRHISFNGPGIMPDGLTGPRPRPRVLVTWGHSISEGIGAAGAVPFHQAVEAVAELGLDCLLAVPPVEVERLGTLPGHARALASVPLQLVLPHCDAIIHQGGYGSALTAAAAGIPQLVIASYPETDMCAARLVAVGAGLHLRVPDLRADLDSRATIRDAVATLLFSTGYADGARRLRADIESQPAPAEVATRLLALITTG
jgi:glycosyltransferase